jgi:S1-C subfamily serine protease
VNVLDLVLVAVLVTAGVGGYRLGLVVGGTAWVFLLQGLVVASLATPVLVDAVAGRHLGPRLVLGLILFVAAALGSHFLGRVAGRRYRQALLPAELLDADHRAGAVVAPVAVLVATWLIVLPPMGEAVGWPRDLVRGSALAGLLDVALPEPPDSSQALRRLTRPVAPPEVLTALGPAADFRPPPRRAALSPGVVARVTASTVRVEGEACLWGQHGSGFTVGEDLVATNAHVVAGERKTAVVRPDGTRLPAAVAVFDPERDLALLRVPGLSQEPLRLDSAPAGSLGAVFGHPEGREELEVSPAFIRQELVASVRSVDLEQPTQRNVYVLSANLEPGDSGGALVTPAGTVAGIAFAIASNFQGVAYALTADELRPMLEQDMSGVADTGPCRWWR